MVPTHHHPPSPLGDRSLVSMALVAFHIDKIFLEKTSLVNFLVSDLANHDNLLIHSLSICGVPCPIWLEQTFSWPFLPHTFVPHALSVPRVPQWWHASILSSWPLCHASFFNLGSFMRSFLIVVFKIFFVIKTFLVFKNSGQFQSGSSSRPNKASNLLSDRQSLIRLSTSGACWSENFVKSTLQKRWLLEKPFFSFASSSKVSLVVISFFWSDSALQALADRSGKYPDLFFFSGSYGRWYHEKKLRKPLDISSKTCRISFFSRSFNFQFQQYVPLGGNFGQVAQIPPDFPAKSCSNFWIN